METKIKWHVGQPVWDKTISKKSGKIESFNNPVEKYPIIVNFSGFKQSYTIDGKLALDILIPTLSTKNYKIKMEGFSQEVEEELPKKGQIVWGLIHDVWEIGYFIGKDEYDSYILSSNNLGIPTNKYNTITTKNPYEDSDVSILEIADREPQIGNMVYAWNEENFLDLTHDIYVSYGTGIKRVYKVGNKVFKHCSLKNPLIK